VRPVTVHQLRCHARRLPLIHQEDHRPEVEQREGVRPYINGSVLVGIEPSACDFFIAVCH
jgi:hypothetical protein